MAAQVFLGLNKNRNFIFAYTPLYIFQHIATYRKQNVFVFFTKRIKNVKKYIFHSCFYSER